MFLTRKTLTSFCVPLPLKRHAATGRGAKRRQFSQFFIAFYLNFFIVFKIYHISRRSKLHDKKIFRIRIKIFNYFWTADYKKEEITYKNNRIFVLLACLTISTKFVWSHQLQINYNIPCLMYTKKKNIKLIYKNSSVLSDAIYLHFINFLSLLMSNKN